jgi:hypothetical protein
MERLRHSDRQRIHRASILQGGLAAILITGVVGCESPRPSITSIPETSSPTASLVATESPTEKALKSLESTYHLTISNELSEPLTQENLDYLSQSMKLFPSDFFDASYGKLQIIFTDNVNYQGVSAISKNESTIYLTRNDFNSFAAVPGQLAYGLFLRKDAANNYEARNEIIQMLGGDKFLNSPDDVYPALKTIGQDQSQPDHFFYDKLLGIANGKVANTEQLIGNFSKGYVCGWPTFSIPGKVIDADIDLDLSHYGEKYSNKIDSPNPAYLNSKMLKLYEAFRKYYEGREYNCAKSASSTNLVPGFFSEQGLPANTDWVELIGSTWGVNIRNTTDRVIGPDEGNALWGTLEIFPKGFFTLPNGENLRLVFVDGKNMSAEDFPDTDGRVTIDINSLNSASQDGDRYPLINRLVEGVILEKYASWGKEFDQEANDLIGGSSEIFLMDAGLVEIPVTHGPFNGKYTTSDAVIRLAQLYMLGQDSFAHIVGSVTEPGLIDWSETSVVDLSSYPDARMTKLYKLIGDTVFDGREFEASAVTFNGYIISIPRLMPKK